MEAFLYFALWFGFVFLIMQLGRHAQESCRGSAPLGASGRSDSELLTNLRWVAPEKDIDPVCHKSVATNTAKSSVYAGQVHYFCSRDCREIFEASPDLYIGPIASKTLEQINV